MNFLKSGFAERPSLSGDMFKDNQGFLIHVKCKHINECVKDMKTNPSRKITFLKMRKTRF